MAAGRPGHDPPSRGRLQPATFPLQQLVRILYITHVRECQRVGINLVNRFSQVHMLK